MHRRQFLSFMGVALAGRAAILVTAGGCVAPHVSPTVAGQKSQAWRCGKCGHLTRSDRDLTDTRCPRCFRKGFMKKVTEKELQDDLN
jgi:DNA-directed RNA polymerase subunit RPC12/RpoP